MMNEGRRNSYDVVSIPSYESLTEQSEISEKLPNDVAVTSQMVQNLLSDEERLRRCSKIRDIKSNAPTPPVSLAEDLLFCELDAFSNETCNYDASDLHVAEAFNSQLMILYEQGDIHSALHFLLDSLHNPFAPRAVGTVFVEQSIREEIIARIHDQMRPLSFKTALHPNYRKTKKVLTSLDVQIVSAAENRVPPPFSSPIVVCDCETKILGTPPTGVVCLRSFHDNLEIVEWCSKESLQFESISVWNECVESLYQLVATLNCNTFYFNSCNVSLEPITPFVAEEKTTVCIADGFHYETLLIGEQIKVVIFPIGSHIWQKDEEPSEPPPSPISFLNS
ncbi:uncharacterized protein LOC6577073 [Drosophila mojavensis]|uniref:Uncharacterized protein n=1 Tax=Drosophila mojavensis TaxID=7230 RepID=B4KJB2_DROMO|nr:uncharacterized protein LOC6577073 [Drosophila mojavensis]EDW12487.1 uncharacterized protein Dmoj_GI17704 [Drosophila mojavensis]